MDHERQDALAARMATVREKLLAKLPGQAAAFRKDLWHRPVDEATAAATLRAVSERAHTLSGTVRTLGFDALDERLSVLGAALRDTERMPPVDRWHAIAAPLAAVVEVLEAECAAAADRDAPDQP